MILFGGRTTTPASHMHPYQTFHTTTFTQHLIILITSGDGPITFNILVMFNYEIKKHGEQECFCIHINNDKWPCWKKKYYKRCKVDFDLFFMLLTIALNGNNNFISNVEFREH